MRKKSGQIKNICDRAYAKNDMGGEHYAKAREAFERAKRNREKAEKLKQED